ncbi:MAG: hypothetical protein KDC38_10975 [Planctomycetes bacterium]|nr:hypothetical protein [Planctomycetota bacterium]
MFQGSGVANMSQRVVVLFVVVLLPTLSQSALSQGQVSTFAEQVGIGWVEIYDNINRDNFWGVVECKVSGENRVETWTIKDGIGVPIQSAYYALRSTKSDATAVLDKAMASGVAFTIHTFTTRKRPGIFLLVDEFSHEIKVDDTKVGYVAFRKGTDKATGATVYLDVSGTLSSVPFPISTSFSVSHLKGDGEDPFFGEYEAELEKELHKEMNSELEEPPVGIQVTRVYFSYSAAPAQARPRAKDWLQQKSPVLLKEDSSGEQVGIGWVELIAEAGCIGHMAYWDEPGHVSIAILCLATPLNPEMIPAGTVPRNRTGPYSASEEFIRRELEMQCANSSISSWKLFRRAHPSQLGRAAARAQIIHIFY